MKSARYLWKRGGSIVAAVSLHNIQGYASLGILWEWLPSVQRLIRTLRMEQFLCTEAESVREGSRLFRITTINPRFFPYLSGQLPTLIDRLIWWRSEEDTTAFVGEEKKPLALGEPVMITTHFGGGMERDAVYKGLCENKSWHKGIDEYREPFHSVEILLGERVTVPLLRSDFWRTTVLNPVDWYIQSKHLQEFRPVTEKRYQHAA